MPISDRIQRIFPTPEEVPETARLPGRRDQTRYLVGGEIRTWDGPRQEALAALDAALKAWDRGRGEWPTMAVADRIRHVESFVYRMRERREEVVRLLMWEIGKTAKETPENRELITDLVREGRSKFLSNDFIL